ncbi:hypothetical protein D9M72_525200 [compost metagenome]
MIGREQRTHRHRLVDARKGLVQEIGVELHHLGLLGFDADRGHGLDRLHGVAAGGGFGRQHHRVGAVQHGVGHVRDLGARGHRVDDHALHHLGGCDGQLVGLARQLDHALLQRRHGGVAHFHGQVAARHHDAV